MKTVTKTLWKSDRGGDLLTWSPGDKYAVIIATSLDTIGLRELAEACYAASDAMHAAEKPESPFDKDGVGVFAKRSERLRAEAT